ncbi:unnamed protein product [Durusdinium trenchii]|uniref:Uncharacterized protein n=1 Tax=Durusdinium trenchii TaxID=1381693 RepID=A0ABP0LCH1_9DINO
MIHWIALQVWLWHTPFASEVTFVHPDECKASPCCFKYVQKEEQHAAPVDPSGGGSAWYFAYAGTEKAITDVVPSEWRHQSVEAMLQNWCVAWQMGPSGEATSSLEVMKDKTCAKGTAYRLSEEGARRYTEFWLGSESSESLASPLGVTVTMKSGQKLNSTLLVPSLPVRDDGYFSQMWFDACEDANTATAAGAIES